MHQTKPLHLAALMLMLPIGAALAQSTSTVEIFGRMDVGLTSYKGVNASTTTTLGSGVSAGSALGVQGEEDLGRGYKAVFVLEHGFYADTGGVSQSDPISGIRLPRYVTSGVDDPTLNAGLNQVLGLYMVSQLAQPFWGRQALVGLITPYGAVMGGRMYSPTYEMFDRYDPMESGNVADPYTLLAVPVGLEVRIDNSVQYRIEARGWSGALMWGASSPQANTPGGSFYGVNAGYESENFSVGVAHQERRNTLGETSLVNNLLGAWWRMDGFKFMGSYTTARDRHPQSALTLQLAVEYYLSTIGVTEQEADGIRQLGQMVGTRLEVDSKVLSLGVQYQATPQLRLIGNHAQLRDGKLAQGDATMWGAAAEYALSKRTSVWTGWTYINNQADQQIAPMTSGTLTGFSGAPGQNTSALQLNLSHKF